MTAKQSTIVLSHPAQSPLNISAVSQFICVYKASDKPFVKERLALSVTVFKGTKRLLSRAMLQSMATPSYPLSGSASPGLLMLYGTLINISRLSLPVALRSVSVHPAHGSTPRQIQYWLIRWRWGLVHSHKHTAQLRSHEVNVKCILLMQLAYFRIKQTNKQRIFNEEKMIWPLWN